MGIRMERAAVFEAVMILLLACLCVALLEGVTAGPGSGAGNWSAGSVNATPFMYAGSDDTLYVFDHNDIFALGHDGRVEWSVTIPAEWVVTGEWYRKPSIVSTGPDTYGLVATEEKGPVFAVEGDMLYLYLCKFADYVDGSPVSPGYREKVVAISRGNVLWEKQLDSEPGLHTNLFRDAWMSARGDRLYVFLSYRMVVMDTNGSVLFSIEDVSDPPAIGPDGRIYVTKSGGRQADHDRLRQSLVSNGNVVQYTWTADPGLFGRDQYTGGINGQDFSDPSGTVDAYSPDGTLLWRTETSYTVARQLIDRSAARDGCTIPIMGDGLLYLPTTDGMVAMDVDGQVEWTVDLGGNVSLLPALPVGPDGTVYMERASDGTGSEPGPIFAIHPGGNVTMFPSNPPGMDFTGASQSTAYFSKERRVEDFLPGIGNLTLPGIAAIDLNTGDKLWEREIAPAETHTVTADSQNLLWLFDDPSTWGISVTYSENHAELAEEPGLVMAVQGSSKVKAFVGRDAVYVSYYLLNYEHPVGIAGGQPPWSTYTRLSDGYEPPNLRPALLNRSKICYASGIGALDRNGTLLWNIPAGSMVTGMAAGNSTIFFGTREGGISGIKTGAVMGITITAGLYLFFRFFLVGSVSRARSRLDNNEKRGRALELVRENPGCTMFEIARSLGLNPGTVRYHLFILGANHRVVVRKDGKYVRYFANSNAYTDEERRIIMLLRRGLVRSLLMELSRGQSSSNAELSRALGVSEAAISLYTKELTEKGIVARDETADGRIRYSISRELRELVETQLKRFAQE